MKIPFEYDPYSTMMELFLMEAAEFQADEILLVSREGRSCLYFVSGSRIRKLIKLRTDIAPELALHIAHSGQPASHTVKTVKIKVLDSDISRRPTVSLRKPAADVDSTVQMPAL